MFEKQGQHYLLLIVLLLGVYFLATGDVLSGQLWGISTQTWLWIAIATPVLHQIVVVFLWRAELYHHKMTEWFGDKAFPIYKVIFTILFVGRPVTLILLGISNANTLNLNPAISYSIAIILFIPFAYTMYSVAHYFGMDRAYGIDHFEPSIYKNKTFCKAGHVQVYEQCHVQIRLSRSLGDRICFFLQSCITGCCIQSSLHLGSFLFH